MSEQIKLLDVTSEQDLDPLALIFSETLVNLGPFFPAGPNPEHVAWRRGQLAKSLEKIKEEEASGKRNKSPLDQTHLVKAVRTDTNEIVGLLLYKIIPSTEGKTTKDEAPKPDPTLPDDVDESWTRFLGIVKGMTKKFMGQRAFVSIDLLLVSSEHRGLGTGASLIRHCFESVSSLESAPKEFFLTATPLATPLYKKLGFKALTHPLEDPSLTQEEKGWFPTAMLYEEGSQALLQ